MVELSKAVVDCPKELVDFDLSSCIGDSLEKLTQWAENTPEIVKGDDLLTLSLSTKPATVVDGGGCCLLCQKWLGSGSVASSQQI